MLLTIAMTHDVKHVLWLTRRQWLGLLHAIIPFSQHRKFKTTSSSDKKHPTVPVIEDVSKNAQLVHGIQFRPSSKESGNIVFILDQSKIELNLDNTGLSRLTYLLFNLAERADWDVKSALNRYDARKVVNSAIQKARRCLDL